MNLSPGRQTSLTSHIVNKLLKQGLVSGDKDLLFKNVKQGFLSYTQEVASMHKDIVYKINSIKRDIHPNSSEWQVLYSQFLQELFRKKSSLFIKK